jgi:hypothetical protein
VEKSIEVLNLEGVDNIIDGALPVVKPKQYKRQEGVEDWLDADEILNVYFLIAIFYKRLG